MSNYFVLKHPIHGYMPQTKGDRGYSHWPDHDLDNSLGVPRLFTSRISAINCRSQWRRGITTYILNNHDERFNQTQDVGRKIEDLQIIPVMILETLAVEKVDFI